MEKDIIIIGAGLTGLTLAYYLKKAGKNVLLIEKQDKTGGVIQSISENNFTYETGPSTGVIGTLEIAELFEDLTGKCELEVADKSAEKRYILRNGKWTALPSGLFSAIGTLLFTWYDKFRILGEPFRKAGTNPDESIADLVKRRLGKSYLDYAVDPFISGVYAGNPEKLITRFALPKLYKLEQNYGSFIRGSIKKAKEPKPYGAEKITRKVFSVKGGLSSLTDALTREIGNEHIKMGCDNVKVDLQENGYQISFLNSKNEEEKFSTSKVITTVGGYALPELLPFVPEETMEPIKSTAYADVVQVAVGFKKWDVQALDGFGGLVPSKEKRDILGILYPSAIFKGRTPEGGALLSVFMGGSKKPEMLQKINREIEEIVLKEIHSTLGEQLKPDFIKIYRHKNAIAQYDVSTGKRLEAITKIENTYKGLFLAGSIRDGIGMADRVKQAKQLADLLSK
ncbi:Protoporphyrinogen oxidase [uncultured Paludibacter sp.]|nr:Protoporphyrinogen oxidase [uncultured Paludibacter sp.]